MGTGQTDSKYCVECGSELTSEAAFCTNCGTAVVAPEPNSEAAAAEPVAPESPPAVEPSTDSKKRRMTLIAVGAVVVVLAVAAGALALTGAFTPSEEPELALEEPSEAEDSQNVADEAEPEPSAPVETAAANPNEGLPITQPARGSDERTALMDSARTRTGTNAQFLVWQLYVQGDSAIGDIQESRGTSAPGNRWLVTWERRESSWEATYHVPFLDAERNTVLASSPYLTEALGDTVLFVVPFATPAQVKDAARIAARLDGPEKVETPSRVPEGWQHEFRPADYGQPGGAPGTEHWHFLDFTDGSRTITLFVGSQEGDFDELTEAPLTVSWGAGGTAYLYQDDIGHAVVGLGDPFEYDWQTYWGHLYADGDSPHLRAALSAMALSMRVVKP